MSNSVYTINGRYRVNPALNQVQDLQTGHKTRLEPRIMAVLEKLSSRAGQIVSREEMICDIWHNYGGGDEGLSQAVSFLRKVFGDQERKLILTIPKKGYQLNDSISAEPKIKPTTKTPYLQSLLKAALLLYVIGSAAYVMYKGFPRQLLEPKQKLSFATQSKPRPLPFRPVVMGNAPVATNSKITAAITHLKTRVFECDQTLPATKLYHPPFVSVEMNKKSYHKTDTTAEMTTSLDYQVTTKLTISTAIN